MRVFACLQVPAFCALASVSAAHASEPPARATTSIVATPLSEAHAIQVDGDLNEAVWQTVPAVTDFVQRAPREGAPATLASELRVAFDETALYVAVIALDPQPDGIRGMLTRRDEESPSDWLRVMIDSYHDRRTAYEFAVNAAGVKADGYWFNDQNLDRGWDAVWDVAVTRQDDGWRAEFRIPFSQLRFNPASSSSFGFAVVRHASRINETMSWPLLANSRSGVVSQFGDLEGLRFSSPLRRLELIPYAVGQVRAQIAEPGNPLIPAAAQTASAGLDVKYAFAPGLSLTATVNPDFGQVEADPAVVNLSGFETFFAERRPFFVEGSGNFAFDIDCNDNQCSGLFYSRRVGRRPQRDVTPPQDGYVATPDSTTILGAAKVTGRIGAFSVGVLNAVTSREEADVAASLGNGQYGYSRTPVEPATNYFLARASREFANQSRVSFMVTSTNRRGDDVLAFLPDVAVTGGVDTDIRFGRRFNVRTMWAGSQVRGSTEAITRLQLNPVHNYQRPDAAHLAFDPTRTSLGGHAGSVSFGKISGRRYRFNTFVGYKSPGFDINDLGFVRRADMVSLSNWHQISWDAPGKYVRRKNINFNQWMGWNFDGDRRQTGGNINSHWTLTNNWSIGSGVNYNGRGFDDRLTRGGPGGYTNGGWSHWGYVNTDGRKAVAADASFSWFRDGKGTRSWQLDGGSTLRPASNLSIRFGAGYSRNHADAQWVRNLIVDERTRYVFGELDQTTVNVSARLSLTITPRLTMQVFAQPFVSAGAYQSFKELVDGRAQAYSDQYAPFDYQGRPDFSVRSFRTTNVLRWEHRPGSALFVVWQQSRDGFAPDGHFSFGRDVGNVFDAPAANVVLVKFSRWFNF